MRHIDPYLASFAIAAIIAAFIGIFRSQLYNRLSTRIVVLMLVSGPLTALLFTSSTKVLIHFGVLGPPGSLAGTALNILITLGTPIVLGLIAAYFVWWPLRHFSDTVASLKQSNYKVKLRSTGISEFDEVFTEFNDLIQRLQHEEKLRKDLISDTSHELNTPLTTMMGQLTAMHEGKLAPSKKRVTIVKEQAERLTKLVKQLDAYTQARVPDAGASEVIDLRQFCEELISHFSLELKQKKIAVSLHITEDFTIRANRKALQQILANFVQNTLSYSEATELTITANNQQLIFFDNGKGVPSDSLPYLFERFYRVDKSRSRTTGGLGLGLAIVRELVEQQGWQVHAEAAKPGLIFILTMN
jgi:two-component system sensor histidine kinase BaeS